MSQASLMNSHSPCSSLQLLPALSLSLSLTYCFSLSFSVTLSLFLSLSALSITLSLFLSLLLLLSLSFMHSLHSHRHTQWKSCSISFPRCNTAKPYQELYRSLFMRVSKTSGISFVSSFLLFVSFSSLSYSSVYERSRHLCFEILLKIALESLRQRCQHGRLYALITLNETALFSAVLLSPPLALTS